MQEAEHGVTRYRVAVEFGDCDPAQIVFFPNFFRWADAASRHYFAAHGIPRWEEAERTHGIIGTPLVNASGRFLAPASYGDTLEIASRIVEWRNTSFVFEHCIRRDGQDIARIEEVRVCATRAPAGGKAIRAVPMPAQWRALLPG